MLVRALGRVLGCDFNRIQFTPDLMPSDVTGSPVYDERTHDFRFRPGPVFTQLLLADEINRAPAKTHSALLEIMQEYRVTVDGTSHPIARPFLVLATQNPIESEGTYNLPEAQLDRFLFKLVADYPSAAEETNILRLHTLGSSPDTLLADDLETVTDPGRGPRGPAARAARSWSTTGCSTTSRRWSGRPASGRRSRSAPRPEPAWRSSGGPGPSPRWKAATSPCPTTSRRSPPGPCGIA